MRVSAHVVPKAQAAFGDDERTTIESGWEDEPSTTVEQGEVAEKIRALNARSPNTNITSTGVLEESTVDDQRVNAVISMITPAAITVQARLVITGGNDAGHELTAAPGKNYTIGRGIDNDLVLTDIAVSRKHFDLRYEAGAWIIVDRGSGNGTLINGNVEDAAFMLANGDTIEIGNTQFRIEIPNSPARPARTPQGSGFNDAAALMTVDVPMDGDDDDDDDASTMNGEPIDDRELGTPHQLPAPQNLGRPKTLPPPAPLRNRAASQAPMYAGHATIPPGATTPMKPSAIAASTMPPGVTAPLPQQQGLYSQHRPGRSPTQAPMMLDDRMGAAPMQIQPSHNPASTLQGQGMPLAPSQLPPDMMYGYPSMPRQGSPGGMIVAATGNGRDATSTALVPPTPYGGLPHLPQVPAPYVGPTISRRTKLVLGGIALTLVAAISTVAIIKGGGQPKPAAKPTPARVEEASTVTARPLPDVKPIDTVRPAPPPPHKEPLRTVTDVKVDPKVDDAAARKAAEAQKQLAAERQKTADADAKRLAAERAKVADAQRADTREAKRLADDKKAEQRAEAKRLADEKKQAAADAKAARAAELAAQKREKAASEPAPKRVATGFDASAAKTKADAQYRAKNFNGAADTLAAAAKAAPADEASALNSLAGTYRQFGKAYNVGMAPATPARDAWTKLKTAQSMDSNAGAEFTAEIKAKMAQISIKAATSFMGAKDYVNAKQAVALAEASGNGGSTVASVRSGLESEASRLYKEAQAESDPDAAKAKYKLIKGIVDAKSPWYQKATKALGQ